MKEFPPFRLDTVNQCLWRRGDAPDDERVLLTPKAFAVLRHLVEHAGRLVTQDELLEAVWPDTFVQPEVLKYQIADIRSTLGDRARNSLFIETLPRRGYRFVAAVTDSEPAGAFGAGEPGSRKTGGQRPRAWRVASLPPKGLERPAPDRLHHGGAGNWKDRPGGRIPTPGRRRAAIPPHRPRPMRGRLRRRRKRITRCWKRWVSCAMVRRGSEWLRFWPRKRPPGWCSFPHC